VGGWSFIEAYNLPVKLREWFVNRLVKQKQDESDQIEAAQKGGSSRSSSVALGPGAGTPPAPMMKDDT